MVDIELGAAFCFISSQAMVHLFLEFGINLFCNFGLAFDFFSGLGSNGGIKEEDYGVNLMFLIFLSS